MSVFDRIVSGIDGSAQALDALQQAMWLRSPNGRILALTVCDLSYVAQAAWSASRIATELEREAERASAEAERELAGLSQSEVRVVEGSPARRLLDAVRDEAATLVALGAHGRSRAAGIVLGSVATRLLHDAPCAVLLTRPPVAAGLFPHSIVAGVDGSPESLAAADVARELAERFGASLRLVAATGGKPVDVDGLVRLELRQPVAVGGGAMTRIPALEWSTWRPLDALLDAAAHADLVVVGSRGLHGLSALGSVSERVAHRARCSVLVVRPCE